MMSPAGEKLTGTENSELPDGRITVERIVVIGGGMVATRFADDLLRGDRGTQPRWNVTILGAEPYVPYNRILLSDVVAGRADIASLTLPTPNRAALHVGNPVIAVDRVAQRVRTRNGETYSYDRLVFATGAHAHLPSMEGLTGSDGERPQGIHVLRSVDDARHLVAAAANHTEATVVGGGLLGLEAAAGLRARGLDVTVIHRSEHLLDRHVHDTAAAHVRAQAHDLGLRVVTGIAPETVISRDGRVTGVRLADGRTLPTSLLLLACGARPRAGLASASGLTVRQGIVVNDATWASPDDPRVHAIGDCARLSSGWTGLITTGWDQARQLAKLLNDGSPAKASFTATIADPARTVVRLKAVGINVVTMGQPGHPDARTVTLDDPHTRRYISVSVADDRLIGATCVGAPDIAADLTTIFDQVTPLPPDPASLLIHTPAAMTAPVGSPMTMPAKATVCRCNGVTKAEVVAAWEGGASTVEEISVATRASTGCGGCRDVVCGLLSWLNDSDPGPRESSTNSVARQNKSQPTRSDTNLTKTPTAP
ncbi:MAG: FAD-dependent oxidoreductase [Actinomycetota bacterium]